MSLGAPIEGEGREVGPGEAFALVEQGALMLDVREPDETAQGHAEAATTIPLSSLGARVGELPTDRTIVVVCRTGSRSALASSALVNSGYEAFNLAGGMEAWRAAGFAVVRDNGTPGFVA